MEKLRKQIGGRIPKEIMEYRSERTYFMNDNDTDAEYFFLNSSGNLTLMQLKFNMIKRRKKLPKMVLFKKLFVEILGYQQSFYFF